MTCSQCEEETFPEFEEAKRKHEFDVAADPGAWGLPPTRHTHASGDTHTHARGDLPHTHAMVTLSDNQDLAKWQSGWGRVVYIHEKP